MLYLSSHLLDFPCFLLICVCKLCMCKSFLHFLHKEGQTPYPIPMFISCFMFVKCCGSWVSQHRNLLMSVCPFKSLMRLKLIKCVALVCLYSFLLCCM